MGTGTFADPSNSSTSYFTFHINQAVIPSSVASSDPYNTAIQLYPNMTGSLIFDPIDDNGSASVGSISASYNGCPCDPAVDVAKPDCGGSNARTITSGTLSAGNPINLTVINQCKPNDDMNSSYTGSYAGGSAEAYITDGAVQCHTAAYYSWMIANGQMDASNMGRSYTPDASVQRCDYNGTPPVCAIDNFSPASTSVATGTGTTLSFAVHGTAGQNWSITPSVIPTSSGTISGTSGSGGGSTGSLTTATTYTLAYGACHASTTVAITQQGGGTPVISVTGGNTQTVTPGQRIILPFNFSNTTAHSTTTTTCPYGVTMPPGFTVYDINCTPTVLNNP
jgi:hypothetical protein